jgi:hypothetical protein
LVQPRALAACARHLCVHSGPVATGGAALVVMVTLVMLVSMVSVGSGVVVVSVVKVGGSVAVGCTIKGISIYQH